jgi:DNA polymerase III subunit gamma/tau
MNFYNEFRPKRLSEVVSQGQVTTILQNQSISGNFSHSYLFSGPSGTGKTSTARILAMLLNCENPQNGEPCCECHSCQMAIAGNHWDITEIDAARYRGIDNVKDLIYKSYLAPFGKRKVYILDECQMLTPEAWSALLKLLEEPPPHLTIILVTPEYEKIPETIVSRCMKFSFSKLKPECIKVKLTRICQAIGVNADPRHLDFIAQSSNGNQRMAENTLQQVCALVVK